MHDVLSDELLLNIRLKFPRRKKRPPPRAKLLVLSYAAHAPQASGAELREASTLQNVMVGPKQAREQESNDSMIEWLILAPPPPSSTLDTVDTPPCDLVRGFAEEK